ncbi:hypothetical protein FSP39_006552 [Pinctada imbricata]|uniref:Uncharacterized protein n=1 Tax=Pinctada imbricata TaxID=66713 RepID=A0AA88YUI4_PINIB|nr:hypothetical protein FSP39_006552 [Pinctada imbricata]
MAVGRLLGDVDSKHEMILSSTREDSILRENGSPRESSLKKERNESSGIENNDEALEGSESASENNSDQCDKNKKRRRRRVKGGKHHKKAKWKPYEKLSWTERRDLEEKESLRANQRREEAFAHGHPVAPFNTTQFLIDDHNNIDQGLKDGEVIRHNSRESNDGSVSGSDTSEDSYSSPDPEDTGSDFLEKEFEETYDSIHAERLQKMSKDELIKDYIEMETKLERLQKRMVRRKKNRGSSASLSSSGEEFLDTDNLRRLGEELLKLKAENAKLRNMLSKSEEPMDS